MENTNNINYWKKIKSIKNNQDLVFIHTPKCGGTYASNIFEKLNIRNKGHNLARKGNGITFTIIRNPIERFESLLNYRLNESCPREDWSKSLYYVYKDTSISLNEIVNKMTDTEIVSFTPYKSLCYWSINIDIFITIDKLEEFLSFFGYDVNLEEFEKMNVSKKLRGTFNKITKNRIYHLYLYDMMLYTKVITE